VFDIKYYCIISLKNSSDYEDLEGSSIELSKIKSLKTYSDGNYIYYSEEKIEYISKEEIIKLL
jgi:hypothetical protein